MNKFVLADTCEVSINKKDETPIIIFQDLPSDNVRIDGKQIAVTIDVEDETMKEIKKTLEAIKS